MRTRRLGTAGQGIRMGRHYNIVAKVIMVVQEKNQIKG